MNSGELCDRMYDDGVGWGMIMIMMFVVGFVVCCYADVCCLGQEGRRLNGYYCIRIYLRYLTYLPC